MDAKGVALTICCFLAVSLSACMSEDDEIEANKERASKIIQAVYAFEQAQGRFPEHLDELVPEHIAEMPKTVQGSDFIYYVVRSEHYDPGHFDLGFELASRRNMGCGYSSKYENWECGFGH